MSGVDLLSEFAEGRKFYTEYASRFVHFWSLEYGVYRIPWNTWNTGGIRQNTGLWEVIWNKYVENVFRQ